MTKTILRGNNLLKISIRIVKEKVMKAQHLRQRNESLIRIVKEKVVKA
jgi:hypothetical protein